MIQVFIRQKGIFPWQKKALPLDVILGKKLFYGQYEKNFLRSPYNEEKEIVAILPESVGRGIFVSWDKNAKREVRLLLNTPCQTQEIRELFRMIRRIGGYWKCAVRFQEKSILPIRLSKLSRYEEDALLKNQQQLQEIANSIIGQNGSDEALEDPYYVQMQAAMWPIAMDLEVAQKVLQDPDYFEQWLHRMQKVDARYCYPDFWKYEDGLVEGQYDVIAGFAHLLPYVPLIESWSKDLKTGRQMQADVFRVNFFSETGEKFIGDMPYDVFLKCFSPEKYKPYDACSFLMEAHTEQELLDICKGGIALSGGDAKITIGDDYQE